MTVVPLPKIIRKLIDRDRVQDDEDDHALEAGSADLTPERPRTEPTDGTLALLYDEIGSALAAQHDHVESLNARAQQLLGFATIILAIVATIVPSHMSSGIRVLYVIAIPVFAIPAALSALAWRIRGYRADPSPLKLWEFYRLEDERDVREQVVSNRKESLAQNHKEIGQKLRLVKWAYWSLLVGFLYVAAVLLYQVAHG